MSTETPAEEPTKIVPGVSDAEMTEVIKNIAAAIGYEPSRELLRLEALRVGILDPQIRTVEGIEGLGCLTIRFKDGSGAEEIAYLVLDICDRDHDLTAQFDLLRPRVSEEQWMTILKHMSFLIGMGRRVFSLLAASHPEIISAVRGNDDTTLHVDPTNTTLYMTESFPKRIGIFIRK